MLTRMRDLVRFQGRVRRLPALYAISLWAAGVIEFVGALVLLFVYSAISKAGAETTNQDAVYEELSSSLFGGEVAKTILNALLVPGTLLVVGGIVFAIASYIGRASDEKFKMRQRYPRVEDTSDVSKYQKLVDVVILVLTIIHALPALAVSIVLIPEIVNGGAPAPGDPWYMSRFGSLLAAIIFGTYAFFGIASAILVLLRKRWAYHALFYFYLFTVSVVMMDSRLLGATGLGKAVFVMPVLALWPLVRNLKVGISVSRSWRGIVLLLFVVPQIVQMLILNNYNFGDDTANPLIMWGINLGTAIYFGVLIFAAYGAINRDPEPGLAEVAASLIVGYPIINALVGLVTQAASVLSHVQS